MAKRDSLILLLISDLSLKYYIYEKLLENRYCNFNCQASNRQRPIADVPFRRGLYMMATERLYALWVHSFGNSVSESIIIFLCLLSTP